eukprot:gnl/MRDRNA2_/MRDRNA2_197569_c0_seq1.p1 gnl/MRDRNA2_/MRDRNA2_197569_c0~~gnl/MRDRNA2_/MRDRNA2_197569_c0_seq1.p1  ORF type:complete len:241 (+),score=27.58 gnl/MRDRNA2_/MRDRNA2_197569_c0_seq1:40-723(+)
MADTFTNFKVENAECFDPRDRVLVFNRIRSTWGNLEAFDEFVHDKLAAAVFAKVGNINHVPYSVVLPPSLCFSMPAIWEALCIPNANLAFYIVTGITFGMLGAPVCISWWFRIGYVCHNRLSNYKACVIATGVFCLVSCGIHTYLTFALIWMSFQMSMPYGCILYALVLIFFIMANYHFFNPNKVASVKVQEWHNGELSYWIVIISLFVSLLVTFNLNELITGKLPL